MIIFYNAVTVSKILIPAGHEREQRPQPTHPAIFDLSGMYRNLWRIRWRQRVPWSGRGLCPEVCRVKSENPHESQQRKRVPWLPCASSWISKQLQTGQIYAQVPHPRQALDFSAQRGFSNNSWSLAWISSWLNRGSTFARLCSFPSAVEASKSEEFSSTTFLPFSVMISARKSPVWSLVKRISLPAVLPGPPFTEVQKQNSSQVLQLKLNTNKFFRRLTYRLSI